LRRQKLLDFALFGLMAATVGCSQQLPTGTAPTQDRQPSGSAPYSVQQRALTQLGRVGNIALTARRLGATFRRARTITRPRTITRRRLRTITRSRFFGFPISYPYSYYYNYPYYSNVAYAANQVVVQNYAFMPYTLNVPVGSVVTWYNADPVAHTTTAPGIWDGELYPGGSFRYQFNTPGSFSYYCRYHPYMHGVINVGGVGGYGYGYGYGY
jgi:plastocyanin